MSNDVQLPDCNKLLDEIDFEKCVFRGLEILKHLNIEPSELTQEVTDKEHVEIKGLGQIYFFVYVELLRQLDEAFMTAMQEVTEDKAHAVREAFMDMISKTPEILLNYFKVDKIHKIEHLPPESVDAIINDLIVNIQKLHQKLPHSISHVFTEKEKAIADAFTQLFAGEPIERLDDVAQAIASMAHFWIEGSSHPIHEFQQSVVNVFNKPSNSIESMEITPLSAHELKDVINDDIDFFGPAWEGHRSTLLSLVLLARIHTLIDEKVPASKDLEKDDNRKFKIKASEFFYAINGLPKLMKEFSDLIMNANILVFSSNQLTSRTKQFSS